MSEDLKGSASYRRIAVVGTTGSGKTTLAAAIAGRLGVPHVELDALHWGPNWTPAEDFRDRTEAALGGDAWVVDGNYSRVRDIVWRRADTVVWLDYALWVILGRLTRRTFRRLIGREVLWNGNVERWRDHFLSRDSLFLWVLQTYRKRRVTYSALFGDPAHAHKRLVRLKSPGEAEVWLEGL